MSIDVIITTVVSTLEGLTARAVQSIRTNDRTEPLIDGEREENILRDFNSFDYNDDIDFDVTDTDFEQFTVPENEDDPLDVEVNRACYHRWKDHRRPAKTWFLLCMKVAFHLTLISSLLGVLSCLVLFVDINTADVCSLVDLYKIPKPIQQIKMVMQAVEGHQSNYFHLLVITFTFGFKLVHKLRLVYWNMCAAFFDTFYRLIIYIFGVYDQPWKSYPLNVLFVLTICVNSFRIATYFFQGGMDRLKLMIQVGLQIVLVAFIILLTFYLLMPWFIKLNNRQQLIVASVSPILGVVAKVTSRLAVQNMAQVTHPGKLYPLSIAAYMTAAMIYRMFQADIESTLYFTLLCLLHGFVGFVEKLSVILKDHFYQWFYRRFLKRENFQSRIGLYKRPKTQRYIADLIICHIIHEHIALLYCNALLQLYPLAWAANSEDYKIIVYDFLLRCFIASTSEYVFMVLSIFVLTWYINMPVIKLWQKNWKRYALVNSVMGLMITCYATHYLILLASTKNHMGSDRNATTERTCNVSQLLFYHSTMKQQS